jgi:hypothetical protein
MAHYYQLDYGYRVRILDGKCKGREGTIVMGSRFGDVGINLKEKPKLGTYHTREKPSNIDVISMDDDFKIKEQLGNCHNEFIDARMDVIMCDPQEAIENPQYFSDAMIALAKQSSLLKGKA